MVKVKLDKTNKAESASKLIATCPGIQISNCKKGGVGKTLLSKLKAVYCLESGLDFYAVDADRQESFLKAYPEFALPTRFSELDRNLKIPDKVLDLALEKLVLVDLPGNVEEAFNHWLTASDILEASKDLGVEIQNWSVQVYTTQTVNTSNWINEQLKGQLDNIQKNQQKLDTKLIQVLEVLAREHYNLKTVSTGLVNSTSVLLKKQKQLVIQTEAARRYAHQTMMIAWIIPISTLLGCMAVLFVSRT